MAFEAGDKLYKFNRILSGVTSEVASFHHMIDTVIKKEHLKASYASRAQ